MQVVRLASEIDFDGWRAAARRLRGQGVAPDDTLWTVDGEGDLFADAASEVSTVQPAGSFTVPREFVDIAQAAILHRSPERFALLYRLLWRLSQTPDLLQILSDPEVGRAHDLVTNVNRAAHKMKAFVRFRLLEGEGAPTSYVAWFEPAHRVTELTAPFFVRRYASQRFSILTPDACAHWDGEALSFTPGADPADAPSHDALEDYWRTYYASTFNPARLKVKTMQKEMPKRYWRNLPEARLIPELVQAAESRTAVMVAQPPSEPARRIVRAAQRASRDAPYDGVMPASLQEIAAGVDCCRRCPLWRDATQGVSGEGPVAARMMLVGEQPGDQEDLAGRPFVGPAGQVLDRALEEAGVPRAQLFVTNAVKHFKNEPRGKRRIHKTPNTSEVVACRWWLDNERRIVRPKVVVALGATAIHAVFGRSLPVSSHRGEAIALPDQSRGLVTYHPSYLLRVPDAATKARAYGMLVEDLKLAWSLAAQA